MTTALIVVDVQNDFAHPDGGLSLAGGENVVRRVNDLQPEYEHVVYTKDFHPPETTHFDQWPVHCVGGTWGAEFHANLDVVDRPLIVHKGTSQNEDGYSGFTVRNLDADQNELTILDDLLKSLGVDTVHIVGLALDVCVRDTAVDAWELGYDVTVIADATAPVTADGGNEAVRQMQSMGITVE